MPPGMRRRMPARSPDLPKLFPTHDGSYGINTLIPIDAEPKKRQKPNAGIAKEQSDDKKWAKTMRGKEGKKYGMNSDLKKAIAQSQNLVEQEEHEGQTSNDRKEPDSHEGEPSSSPSFSQSVPPIPEIRPHVPHYDPSHPPFSEEDDDRPRPPYKRAELSSPDPHEFFGVNQPISPPSEHVPFYGIPQGGGSKEPMSPTRPDTSRSFNLENGLFANATLQAPELWRIPTPATSNSTQSNESTSVLSSLEHSLASVSQPRTSSNLISSEQSNPQGQLAPNQPTSSWQPKPGTQSDPYTSSSYPLEGQTTADRHPNPREKSNSRQPLNIVKEPTRKDSTRTQEQPSKSPNIGVRKTTGPSLARNGRGANRKKRWQWPSPGLIIPPILMFLALALAVWFILSSIPVDWFNGSDADVPHSSATRPFFGFGNVWRKISGLLPETSGPNDYVSCNTSGPSESCEINLNDLMADLRKRTPEWVWVQGDKNGKIKIPEDFWHALKSLIERDDDILSLKNSDISEDHWRAIKTRIQAAGLGAGESTNSIEGLVDKKTSQSWDKWLKQNGQLLKKAETGVALTKDDFMKLYEEESASYQREIRQELTELQKRIGSITEQMAKLPDEITSNASMGKAEITRLVNSLVSKTINSATLDAVARGFIKGNAKNVLANQVNYFGIGAGVVIDPDTSSSGWEPPKNHYISKSGLDRDGYKLQPRMAALSPWEQEGECFCAGPDRKGYGKGTNNLTILMSRDIIPQHFVVEHILPGATLDPGAMPREIEVWGYIEEVNLRKALQTFSERQFPDTPKENILSEGFVKMGHFTYENRSTGDGVQVFKISDEVATLGAFTNRMVVRAINNYGADHTCFYRLRLYGEVIERPEDPPPGVEEKKKRFWFF
ncbi:hypothetical protein F5Y07DRAFT_127220 [Xylaria sp. FL0933]|nr:hypothetical protein F5Y07DRAFT_127220 [Xylaria sp. FL0933]